MVEKGKMKINIYTYLLRLFWFIILFLFFVQGLINEIFAQSCPNSNFSLGNFTGWSGCSGLWCAPPPETGWTRCSNPYVPFNPPCNNPGQPWYDNPTGGHFSIEAAPGSPDPYIPEINTVFAGDAYSACLGYRHLPDNGGGYVDQLTYQFAYDSRYSFFIYRFAAVLCNIVDPTHDTPDKRPRFTVEIRDHATQTLVDPVCGFFDVYPGDGQSGWQETQVGNQIVQYKNWNSVGIDLSTLSSISDGQILDIVFTTHGCAYTAHTAYAYISTVCSKMTIILSGCEGSNTVTLTAPTGFEQYEWYGPICGTCSPTVVCTEQSCTVTNVNSGDVYRLNMVSFNGCPVNDVFTTISFTSVIPAFSANVNCVGNESTFTDLSTSTNIHQPIVSRRWRFDAGGTWEGPYSDPVITHIFTSVGTYEVSVEATSQDGCTGTTSQTVTVSPAPTLINPSLNKSFCSGENVNLTLDFSQSGASASWTSIVTSGSATITPNPPGQSGNLINDQIINTGSGIATVTYTITPEIGECIGVPVPGIITVLPPPTATISGTTTVCSGDTEPIVTFTGVNGTPPFIISYKINGGSTLTVTTTTGNSVTVSQPTGTPGTYIYSLVSVVDLNTCTQSQTGTATVTVNPRPNITNTILSQEVCSGLPSTPVILQADIPGTTYSWVSSASAGITGNTPSGTGDIPVQTLFNSTLLQGNATYTVTPTYTFNGVSCSGLNANYTILVNPLPTPTFTAGENPVCVGVSGKTYTTQSGKQDYIWTVPPEATITAGGTLTDNSVTVTWNTVGSYIIEVNYTEPLTQCTAVNPSHFDVTINPLPSPTFTAGESSVCIGLAGKIYTTQAGMQDYVWTIPSEATVTAGGTSTSNSVTLTWNTVGNYSISVNYTDPSTHCTAVDPTTYNVTVNPLPVPTLSGESPVCIGVAGKIYTTQAGKQDYIWTIPPQATLTSGGTSTDNIAIVTWNTVGTFAIGINYREPGTLCTAVIPGTYTVTVNTLPNPTFTTGENPVCVGVAGKTYVTESGKSNYIWTIPPQATITAGGTSTDNSVTVTWNTVGNYIISINYTEPSTLCTAVNPTPYNVTVNPLPTPSFTAGESSVCIGVAGKIYATQAGKQDYVWIIPPEATVTAGGTSTSNSVTLTWNIVGNYTISVNYTEPSTQCTAVLPTPYNVTVNPLPVPILSGESPVCIGVSGKTYTTQTGKQDYVWTIPPQATVTSGGTSSDNTVTVTWNTVGNYSISINYSEPGTLCTSVNPFTLPVTVNPLPTPTFTAGEASVCVGVTGKTYTTQSGKSNYIWTIPPEATITAGGTSTDNSVTVTWNTVGSYTISVNYTEPSTQCTAVNPTNYNVTVNPLPTPSFTSGVSPVCVGVAGKTYVTQSGKSSYVWSIPPQATITAGGNSSSNSVTLTWNAIGNYTLSVNYTEPSTQCTAVSPTPYSVTVNPLPVPAITGPASPCLNVPVQYSTEDLMTGYTWSVSPGGTIQSGQGTRQVQVNWSAIGNRTISVNYTDPNGCTAVLPTTLNVNVNTLPVPTITGDNPVCERVTSTYTTESGAQSYSWTLPTSGVTIISGGGTNDNTVTIQWNTPGAYSISVNYVISTGCTAPQPTIFPVTVKPSPTPTFVQGTPELCQGATGVVYSTQTGMSNYAWTVSPGGVITSGGGSNNSSVTITWASDGAQSVSVNYANSNGCTALNPTVYDVTVHPLPITAFTGSTSVCQAYPDPYLYTANASVPCTYTWSIIPNTYGTIANPSANPASITWNITGNATLRLDAFTNYGCTSFSTQSIQIDPKPEVSITACFDPVTSRSAKPFMLKGGKPLLTGSPQQGEYLISPSTSALYYSSGYYYFDPSIVPGSSITVFTITYKYTNQYGCPATTTGSVPLTVRGPNPACGSSMTDYRDGTSYRTSLVAGKCWMMENLRYGSTLIPATKAQTDNCTTERYCLSSDANCSAYGGLYQWDELIQYSQTSGPDYQGVCPPGWHVPSSLDWQNLIDASGGNGLAAGSLTDLNLTPDGFEALLKGIYYMNTTWAFTVSDLPKGTMFWTSTPGSGSRFITRGINSKNPSVSLYESSKANAFPVRCVRD